MGRAAAIAALLGPVGCHAEDVCRGSDAKHYNEGLAYHLHKRGAPYKVTRVSVCVAEARKADISAAENELGKYFHEVAHLMKDECEEQALVEWATKHALRFDVRQAYDLRRRPSGRMFLLRSFTSEELVSNRARLDTSAPKGAQCGVA